jgi:hypothetical protein
VDDEGRPICISSRTMDPLAMDMEAAVERVRDGACMAVFCWAGVFRGISASSLSTLAVDPTASSVRALLHAAATRAVPLEAAPIHAIRRRARREPAMPTDLLVGLAREHLVSTRDQGIRCILGSDRSPFVSHQEDPATVRVFTEPNQMHALRDVMRARDSRGVSMYMILDFCSTEGIQGVPKLIHAIETIMLCFRENVQHHGLIVWPVASDDTATALSAGSLLACAAGTAHEPRLLRNALTRACDVNVDAILIYV